MMVIFARLAGREGLLGRPRRRWLVHHGGWLDNTVEGVFGIVVGD